jgi:hypothetical protein
MDQIVVLDESAWRAVVDLMKEHDPWQYGTEYSQMLYGIANSIEDQTQEQ